MRCLASVFRGKLCDVVLRNRKAVAYKKDAVLYDLGDKAQTFFFIRSGFVKIGAVTEDGREVIYDVRKDGDVVGELSACKAPRRDRAVALEETQVIPVPYSEIIESIRGNPGVSTFLVEVFCDALREAYSQINALSEHHLLSRVTGVLRSLALKMGVPAGDAVTIPIYLTQEEISQMVGARRERVSTALNLLRRRGIVQYSIRGQLIVRLADQA